MKYEKSIFMSKEEYIKKDLKNSREYKGLIVVVFYVENMCDFKIIKVNDKKLIFNNNLKLTVCQYPRY